MTYRFPNFVYINHDNIDTDQIISSEYLKTTTRSNLKSGLFKDLFLNSDSDDLLDQIHSPNTSILINGKNFGCGSSREHAVWALKETGIHFIIAESFADIFYSNAIKNKLLPICLGENDIQRIITSKHSIEINLNSRQIVQANTRISFLLDDDTRSKFLNNETELDYLLRNLDRIQCYEQENHV
jgi:3-isopropylmalate/(R)-2-methylmalate dehydratase small subunit